MSNESLIQCAGLSKSYPLGAHKVDVLRDVSISVNEGETVSIMGASGSGKSTLLHAMGGLDKPDAGFVKVAGEDIYRYSDSHRTQFRATELGFVFQSYHLLPELTLFENVMLPLIAHGKVGREHKARAEELLDSVKLSHRLEHKPNELSGGEQQRASIARALINCPKIVLADEPTGNLDSKTGEQILEHLFGLTEQEGRTLVMVTHNEEIASRCSRQLQLVDGQINY